MSKPEKEKIKPAVNNFTGQTVTLVPAGGLRVNAVLVDIVDGEVVSTKILREDDLAVLCIKSAVVALWAFSRGDRYEKA